MWPKLVTIAKTPCIVTVKAEEPNEFGELKTLFSGELMCNYQSKANTRYTAAKTAVQVAGTALFDGDICPDVGEITSGTVMLFGQEREIASGAKARNPDGTVNYTRLDLK